MLSLFLAQASAAALADGPAGVSMEEYRSRRETVRKEIGPDALFVLKGATAQPGVTGFRQSSSFYYLSGVTDPGVILMLDPEGPEGEILFLPDRNLRGERWDGLRLYPGEEAEKATGFGKTRPLSEYEELLAKLAARKKVIYYNYRRVPVKESLPVDLDTILRLQLRGSRFGRDPIRLANTRSILTGLRQVKSQAETELLTRAITITCDGIREAMRTIKPGMYEYQIQAILEYVFRREGAERTGFASIVGSGPNSCVLHYRDNTRRMEAGDLVVVDVGAEFGYYTADVTRTFPISGKMSPRQKEIYEIVLKAQKEAFEMVRPGSTKGEVHQKAKDVIEAAGYGKYFIHGTSHWLGLDVHDVGQRGRKLEPGMVLTVEPGIYIPEEEIGVRIEDDLLVTDEGYLHLSAPLARELDEIERIQAEPGLEERAARGGTTKIRQVR